MVCVHLPKVEIQVSEVIRTFMTLLTFRNPIFPHDSFKGARNRNAFGKSAPMGLLQKPFNPSCVDAERRTEAWERFWLSLQDIARSSHFRHTGLPFALISVRVTRRPTSFLCCDLDKLSFQWLQCRILHTAVQLRRFVCSPARGQPPQEWPAYCMVRNASSGRWWDILKTPCLWVRFLTSLVTNVHGELIWINTILKLTLLMEKAAGVIGILQGAEDELLTMLYVFTSDQYALCHQCYMNAQPKNIWSSFQRNPFTFCVFDPWQTNYIVLCRKSLMQPGWDVQIFCLSCFWSYFEFQQGFFLFALMKSSCHFTRRNKDPNWVDKMQAFRRATKIDLDCPLCGKLLPSIRKQIHCCFKQPIEPKNLVFCIVSVSVEWKEVSSKSIRHNDRDRGATRFDTDRECFWFSGHFEEPCDLFFFDATSPGSWLHWKPIRQVCQFILTRRAKGAVLVWPCFGDNNNGSNLQSRRPALKIFLVSFWLIMIPGMCKMSRKLMHFRLGVCLSGFCLCTRSFSLYWTWTWLLCFLVLDKKHNIFQTKTLGGFWNLGDWGTRDDWTIVPAEMCRARCRCLSVSKAMWSDIAIKDVSNFPWNVVFGLWNEFLHARKVSVLSRTKKELSDTKFQGRPSFAPIFLSLDFHVGFAFRKLAPFPPKIRWTVALSLAVWLSQLQVRKLEWFPSLFVCLFFLVAPCHCKERLMLSRCDVCSVVCLWRGPTHPTDPPLSQRVYKIYPPYLTHKIIGLHTVKI